MVASVCEIRDIDGEEEEEGGATHVRPQGG